MSTKLGASKEYMITILKQQHIKLIDPYKLRLQEIRDSIEQAINASPEMHQLNALHEHILEYLISQGVKFDSGETPILYKDIHWDCASALRSARGLLYRKLKQTYAEPFKEELELLNQQKSAIDTLYGNIITTVRSLTPTKAKKYIMELQLNIPAESFINEPKPSVLPDNPILQAVRSQLLTQIGGPTNE